MIVIGGIVLIAFSVLMWGYVMFVRGHDSDAGQKKSRDEARPWADEMDLIEKKLDSAIEDSLPKGCSDEHSPVRYSSPDCPSCELIQLISEDGELLLIIERALKRGSSKRKLRAALRHLRESFADRQEAV